jgi:hypothetical protein
LILIAGDSWGCGEWAYTDGIAPPTTVLHAGLGQYLTELGHQVVNLSLPGNSNSKVIAPLRNFLKVNVWAKVDCIIVFQTEWHRDPPMPDDVAVGYPELVHRMLTRFYMQLSDLSQESGVPIYLVGGCADTMWYDEFEQEHPGVKVVCQSLVNLLLNNDHKIDDPVLGTFLMLQPAVLDGLKKKLGVPDIARLLDDVEVGHQRIATWKANPQHFYPDTHHANRHAHQQLTNLLMPVISSFGVDSTPKGT